MEIDKSVNFAYKFASATRDPPCTPEQFAEELEKREVRATNKGVKLFTSGSDQPFVLDKYKKAFKELTYAEKFQCDAKKWGDDEIAQFAGVLAQCKDVTETWPPC